MATGTAGSRPCHLLHASHSQLRPCLAAPLRPAALHRACSLLHGLAMQFLRSDWRLDNLNEHDSTRLPAWVSGAGQACRSTPTGSDRALHSLLVLVPPLLLASAAIGHAAWESSRHPAMSHVPPAQLPRLHHAPRCPLCQMRLPGRRTLSARLTTPHRSSTISCCGPSPRGACGAPAAAPV